MSRQRGGGTRMRPLRLPRRLGLLGLALLVLATIGAFVVPTTASASSSCDAAPALHAGPATECTIVVAGTPRTYLLSVPGGGRPAPLVVAFHGLYQTASGFAAQTGLVPAARASGLALALPESEGPAFNDSRLGRGGPADDAFTLALVGQLVDAGIADPRRVVVTGFSNGAGMAMEVASAHPRTVAAVVSIDGSLIAAPGAPRPTAPVRTVLVHGTADRVQPWGGRPAKGQMWPAYLPVPETVSHWVTAAGAGPAVVSHVTGPRDVEVSVYTGSRANAHVTAYTVTGMGHEWPVKARDTIDATALVTQVGASAVRPLEAQKHSSQFTTRSAFSHA